MSKGIDYVVCAAGKAERFKKNGMSLAKPLVKLRGVTLLERSLMSLDFYANDRLIIITQKDDDIRSKMEKNLSNLYPFLDIIWLEISYFTSGQLETFYLAKKHLRQKKIPVAIFNCDTYFRSKELNNLLLDESIQGIIPCAKASGNAWSFCKVNSDNDVLEIQEKVRISNMATVGFYFFRDTSKLLKNVEKNLRMKQVGERYVAPLYQIYIDNKEKIKICVAETFFPMGTIEQVKDFWKVSPRELAKDNSTKVIVIDLDDTITIDKSSKNYNEKSPNKKIVKKLQEYRNNGFEIIIQTARNMKTYKGREDKVLANIGQITFEWLIKHKVPYDGIRFGKPYAENGFYVDDRAIRPDEFLNLDYDEIIDLLKSQ